MGKKVQKMANQLGLLNQPKYTFYVQPRKIKGKFSRVRPDVSYIIEDWMGNIDSTAAYSETTTGRTYRFYHIAPELKVFVDILDKISGGLAWIETSHSTQIDIYTTNEDYVRALVKILNGIWDDGMVPHLNIEKLEKKFNVKGDDIIKVWNSFL